MGKRGNEMVKMSLSRPVKCLRRRLFLGDETIDNNIRNQKSDYNDMEIQDVENVTMPQTEDLLQLENIELNEGNTLSNSITSVRNMLREHVHHDIENQQSTGQQVSAASQPEDISVPSTSKDIAVPSTAKDITLPSTSNDITVLSTSKDIAVPSTSNDITLPSTSNEITLLSTSKDIAVPSTSNDITLPSTSKDCFAANPAKDPKKSRKNHSRRVKANKNYFDFLSDDECLLDFDYDTSSSWQSGSEQSSENDSVAKKKKKRTKIVEGETVGEKGYKIKRSNKKKERREKRRLGKQYVDTKGCTVPPKELLPNICADKMTCTNKCWEIPEERRQCIFKHFWSIEPKCRREWLVGMTKKMPIKRKRVKDSEKRNYTYIYQINEGESKRAVCQKFLMCTLNVSQKYLHYTVSNASDGFAKNDVRGKLVPANKTCDDAVNKVVEFIKKLPAVPSHYCRRDSTKLYLPAEFKNIKKLYNDYYKKEFKEKRQEYVGERIFRNIFCTKFNIGFHIPKKDKCLKCMRYNNDPTDVNQKAKEEHLQEVTHTDARFKYHKTIRKENPEVLCACFDMQKVLNTPYGDSMLLYYSRKYGVYNLSVYENVTRKGFCYTWGEADGKRGANEVSTILRRYILDVDSRGTAKTLLLYSDACPGQNKNRIIVAAIHHILQNECVNIETIQLNYLLPGHSFMPVDSLHGVIENSVSNIKVWAQSQWSTIFELARKEPEPYEVECFEHDDFIGWSTMSEKYFKGNLIGKISRVRIATFKKSVPQKITIKYSMDPKAISEDIAVIGSKSKPEEKIYKARLPIPKKKYDDLIRLCKDNVIPKKYHREYEMLTYDGAKKDVLLDSDIEDVTDGTD